MFDNCLGVTAIGLGITGVDLLSTIVAAPAVIGIEAVSIVMGLLGVVGNQAIKKLSLKIEKHEKIAMLAVSTLNTINSLTSKVLSDDSIPDEEYSLILLTKVKLNRKPAKAENGRTYYEKNLYTGNGLTPSVSTTILPCYPIALVERLDILMACKAAENTGVRNELVSVCNELLRQDLVDKHKYQIIMLQL